MSYDVPLHGFPWRIETGATYDVVREDNVILCSPNGIAQTITFPLIEPGDDGSTYFVKNISGATITIQGTPPNRIDTAPSKVISTTMDAILAVAAEDADGNDCWFIIGSYQNGSP